ncbi:hypothetical protein PORCRE_299 [Porphyromonas crevioricanis JCM 15906]|uniref:Uncharacterized protein n=1 Tax=Porphyromonas crevioricanis JCM 15906 TaxID=1305617 RepID=T1DQZ0_9PORP|nr:hypothetical protein PORCRE_299 [Porphyromonas crevioricanis JCM 15906]
MCGLFLLKQPILYQSISITKDLSMAKEVSKVIEQSSKSLGVSLEKLRCFR